MEKCKECGKEVDTSEVARVYGTVSAVWSGGFCSAKCYTDHNIKKMHDRVMTASATIPQRTKIKVMQNMVETRSGEIVEILSGTLICENKAINWATIGDWMSAQPDGFSLMITTIGVEGRQLGIQIPDKVPTFNLNSLLEHFEYQ